jgi:hypothetical protein
MSTKTQVEWRRTKVLELLSKGDSQSDIAKTLQVDLSIISRDIFHLRQQAKSNIKGYIDERLPEEYEKCMIALTAILKEAWNTSQQALDKREKIQALSLAKECYSMKLDYLQMLLSWMMPLGLSLPGQIRNRNPQVTTMKMIKNQTNPITMKTEIS